MLTNENGYNRILDLRALRKEQNGEILEIEDTWEKYYIKFSNKTPGVTIVGDNQVFGNWSTQVQIDKPIQFNN